MAKTNPLLRPAGVAVNVESRWEAGDNCIMEASELEEIPRMLLTHLDGQHDRAMLIDLAEKWMKEKSSPRPREELRKYVYEVLESFASSAMWIG